MDLNKIMITIYTDGSCLGNPGKGGYAAILVNGKHKKIITGGYTLTTNNRMEIKAIVEGLKAINNPSEVTIKTDSRLICDTFNKGWIFSWEKNGWGKGKKREPVRNLDLLKELLQLYNTHTVKFEWVKAHSGIALNEECDILAKEAAEVATETDLFYELSKGETVQALEFKNGIEITQKAGRLSISANSSTIEIQNSDLEKFINDLKMYI